MNEKIIKEMVLFPSDKQFDEKNDELRIGACWWSIPSFPNHQDRFINTKIYFYDKRANAIIRRSTITEFGWEMGKKVVYFEDVLIADDEGNEINEDEDFYLDLSHLPPRKQTRGWCYRWWNNEDIAKEKKGT
jgi:hypothetical protein